MPILIKILDSITVLFFYFYLGLFVTDYSFILLPLYRMGLPFGNISNISGPTMALSFLLLSRYAAKKGSFLESPVIKSINKLASLGDKKLLFMAGAAIFIVFSVLSTARHLSLSSGASDLGIFDQAIWNTTRGNLLFSSLKGNMSLLGDHFEPILLLIAPLYMIWQNVIVLFLVQSVLLASAVIPLYLIAKDRLNSRFLIFTFIFAYVLSRPLRGVGLSDFHPECFILPLFFWAYYFINKGKNLLLFLTIFLLLLCKEDTAFLISGLGIFLLFAQKRFKLGAALFIIGVSAWLLETKIIIPYFNPSGNYPYMDRLPFGLTYIDNIKTVFNDPAYVISSFLTKEKIAYCVKMLAPLGYLTLFSPAHYILVAIPLFKNLLPVNPNFSGFYDITSHYTASVIPFIFIGAIYGSGWLIGKIRHKRAAMLIGGFVILSSLLAYSKTDGYKLVRFLDGIKNNHSVEVLSYLEIVPKDASVAANFNLVPHLSHRKYIFEWNPQSKTGDITEYIVIDMNLLGYLSRENKAMIEPYLKNIATKGYKIIFSSRDMPFFIYRKPDIDKTLVEKL